LPGQIKFLARWPVDGSSRGGENEKDLPQLFLSLDGRDFAINMRCPVLYRGVEGKNLWR
jgi:hypothetical protein